MNNEETPSKSNKSTKIDVKSKNKSAKIQQELMKTAFKEVLAAAGRKEESSKEVSTSADTSGNAKRKRSLSNDKIQWKVPIDDEEEEVPRPIKSLSNIRRTQTEGGPNDIVINGPLDIVLNDNARIYNATFNFGPEKTKAKSKSRRPFTLTLSSNSKNVAANPTAFERAKAANARKSEKELELEGRKIGKEARKIAREALTARSNNRRNSSLTPSMRSSSQRLKKSVLADRALHLHYGIRSLENRAPILPNLTEPINEPQIMIGGYMIKWKFNSPKVLISLTSFDHIGFQLEIQFPEDAPLQELAGAVKIDIKYNTMIITLVDFDERITIGVPSGKNVDTHLKVGYPIYNNGRLIITGT